MKSIRPFLFRTVVGWCVPLGLTGLSPAQAPAKLPPIEPLFDHAMRDVSVCVGPDGTYYMTGTTGDNPAPGHDKTGWWCVNEGIRVWQSKDLQNWEALGLVWSLDRDATWGKEIRQNGATKVRAVWAPEIFHMKGTFWLTYCMNYGGCGLLKSTTGKAEGPYQDVKKDGPLTMEIDPSLFQDDDGKVYWLFMNGKIARMNDDMTGLAEEPRLLKPTNFGHVGHEGAFLSKHEGKYYLICAEWIDGYSCMVAVADNVYGPYGPRYLAIPQGGHNTFFTDTEGNWWSTIWGNDGGAPFRERPGILRIDLDVQGHVRPMPVSLEKRPWWTAAPPRKTSTACMFVGSATIELEAPAKDVRVVYTLDGSIPTTTSPVYQKPIDITRDTVVKARAVWPGGSLSRVLEFPMLEALPGRPLITNPGFESGPLPWLCNSEVLVDSDLDMDNDGVHYTPHEGKKHFRLQGGKDQTINLTQAIALPAGDYEMSAWVMSRANSDNNLGPNLSLELLDGKQQVVKPANSSSPDCLSPKGAYVKWTRQYTGLASGAYTVKFSAGPTDTVRGKQGWVDDFSLLPKTGR
ncbi:MAG: family 43 glycosylhydrolase [Verrucomicrobia bacterium]|nr:family 43 glycosylhydrolase [Verrucomicrobiota bacterium]